MRVVALSMVVDSPLWLSRHALAHLSSRRFRGLLARARHPQGGDDDVSLPGAVVVVVPFFGSMPELGSDGKPVGNSHSASPRETKLQQVVTSRGESDFLCRARADDERETETEAEAEAETERTCLWQAAQD